MEIKSLLLLNIIGALISLFIVLGNFTTKKYKRRKRILFLESIMIFILQISAVVFAIVFDKNTKTANILMFVFRSIDIISVSLLIFIISIYVGYLAFDDELYEKMILKITFSILLTNVLLVIINFLAPINNKIVPILFSIDSNGTFNYNLIGTLLIKIFNYISLLISMITVYIFRKNTDKEFFYPVLFSVFPILISDVYFLIYKEYELNFLFVIISLLAFYMAQSTRKYTDEFTGLGNRQYLIRKIEKWLKYQSEFKINALLIDINEMDNINDLYGHYTGDKVILSISKIVTDVQRNHPHTTAIRFRGKEMILLFKEKNDQELENYKNEVLFLLNRMNQEEDFKKTLDIAIGTYSCSNKEFDNKEEYLVNLDQKMYQAHDKIARLIDEYIKNDKFFIYYQPIYDIKKGRYTKIEALLRCKDENGSFINPELIINSAEKTGIETISKLGEIILEKVCRYCSCEEFKSLGI